MHKGKYVFAQLLDFIDKDVFLRLANKADYLSAVLRPGETYQQAIIFAFGVRA